MKNSGVSDEVLTQVHFLGEILGDVGWIEGQNGWRIYQKGSLAQGKVKDILLRNPAFQMGRRGVLLQNM